MQATARATRSNGKPRLSADLIVETGLDLASQPGVTTMSVRELGTKLGADPTAIYRHFRNKEHLMQALLDQLHSRALVRVTAPHADWQERLRQNAIALLDEYVRHPAIATEAVVLTTHGAGEADSIEFLLDAFTTAGLDDEEVMRHYALFASHVLSVGAGMARNRGNMPPEALDTSPWFDGPLLVDPRTHPLITKFGSRIVNFGDRELFLLGVESVIDSAARHAAQ